MATIKHELFWSLLAVLLVASAALAQVTTATFYGLVQDPSGAVIPGAEITMTNELTGITTRQVTNASGDFALNFLPIGRYTLTIERKGFKTYVLHGLSLQAGEHVQRTFSLQVGSVRQQVTVSGHPPMVNVVSPEQAENISSLKVRELPLAQRNLMELGGLATGSIVRGSGSNDSGQFNFNGLGHSAASITVDGTEASANPDSSDTQMFGGFNNISLISLEAVQQVQITKGILPAEYAPTMSGNFNIITKSGTNQWHGSLFENYQGAALNARYQFLPTKPGFTFNQFGGSVGGPIVKNKLFVFGVYEGYREASFAAFDGDVPSPYLRSEMLAAVPAYKLWVDAWPLPNQPTSPTAYTGVYIGSGSGRSDDNQFVVKPTYWISSRQEVAVTYTRDRPSSLTPSISPLNPRTFTGQSDRVTATYTTFGSKWTSETRFGFNKTFVSRLDAWNNVKSPTEKETIPDGARVPDIHVEGIDLGGGEILQKGGPGTFSFGEKVAMPVGKHMIKFGGSFTDIRTGGKDIESPRLKYSNVSDLLANIPSQVRVTFGVNQYYASAKAFGFFVQDHWRMTQKLVMDLGLREDYFGNMTASNNGKPPYLYNPDGILNSDFALGSYRPTSDPFNSSALNLSPRFGLVYNPDGNGRNVFRLGFGQLFSPIVLEDFIGGIVDSPNLPFRVEYTKSQAKALALNFPVYNQDVLPLAEGNTLGDAITVVNPTISNPYSLDFYAGYERQLTPSLMLESAFVGDRGVKIIMRRDYNYPDRVTGVLPNPAIGTGEYFDNSDSSNYFAWQTTLRKRYSKGLTFDVNYTWSKALSYGVGDIGSNPANLQSYFNIRSNYGPQDGSRDNIFTADYVYDLPGLNRVQNSFIHQVLTGWETSGIFTAETGTPLDINEHDSVEYTRPDATGIDPVFSNFTQTLQYLNPAAFSYVPISKVSGSAIRPGTLGNGAVWGPGEWDLDFSLARNFSLWENVKLQLRADMFNAFNHTNLVGVQTEIDKGQFGQITSTTGARQIQVNARLTF